MCSYLIRSGRYILKKLLINVLSVATVIVKVLCGDKQETCLIVLFPSALCPLSASSGSLFCFFLALDFTVTFTKTVFSLKKKKALMTPVCVTGPVRYLSTVGREQNSQNATQSREDLLKVHQTCTYLYNITKWLNRLIDSEAQDDIRMSPFPNHRDCCRAQRQTCYCLITFCHLNYLVKFRKTKIKLLYLTSLLCGWTPVSESRVLYAAQIAKKVPLRPTRDWGRHKQTWLVSLGVPSTAGYSI